MTRHALPRLGRLRGLAQLGALAASLGAIGCGTPVPSFANGEAPGTVVDYATFRVDLIASVRPRSETAPELLSRLLETADALSDLGAQQVDVVAGEQGGKRELIGALYGMPPGSSPGMLLSERGTAIWTKRPEAGRPPIVWDGKDGVVLQFVAGVWLYASSGSAQAVVAHARRSGHSPERIDLAKDSLIEGWFLGEARGGGASKVVRIDEAEHLEQSWMRIAASGNVVAHATYVDSAAARRAESAGNARAAQLKANPVRQTSSRDQLALETFELSRSGRELTYVLQLPITRRHAPARPAPCPVGSSFDGKRCVH
ncbi:MAG TPA: hypothetical protein PKD61_06905 [Polyangiaceae bacterium]|nr:hypothetical protein [Polyangiaceae bacterium]